MENGREEIYIPMSTHGQYKSNCFCNGVVGHWLPKCSGHSRWKRECGQDIHYYVRTLSESPSWFCRKHIWRQKSSFMFQHDNTLAHTACRTVAWFEQQDISTIQWSSQSPDLNIIEQVWDFMGREIVRVVPVTRNDLIWALHNAWLNSTVPCLHNLYNSLPRRLLGAGLPHKVLINKVQYLIMSHFSWKKYLFAANYGDKKSFLIFEEKQRLIWHFQRVASFLSQECIMISWSRRDVMDGVLIIKIIFSWIVCLWSFHICCKIEAMVNLLSW